MTRPSRAAAVAALLLLPLLLVGSTCGGRSGFMPKSEFRERQDDYLAYATAGPIQPGSLLNVLNHLERQDRDASYSVPDDVVPADAWDPVFDKLWRLRDTSDFDLLYLMNLVYAQLGDPAVPLGLWGDAKQAMLDFKYWYTDPTPERIVDGEQVVDSMWYWTENHVLLFRVNEYLAGQLMPDQVFRVTGQTGEWHRDRARVAILEWLDERARFGFTEWHSDVYYQKDITPLLSLVEWADDEELARRAALVLDLVLLDVALHLHKGNFGSTHGRSYVKDKVTASLQDNFHSSKLLFDDTVVPYRSAGAPDATLFARAKKYRLPEVIRRIAKDDRPMLDRQRMNLPLDEEPPADLTVPPEAPFGMDYRDERYLPFWWSMGSQSLWMMLPLLFEVADRDGLWDSQFSDFRALRDIVLVPGDPEATVLGAQEFSRILWPLINQAVLKEVNTTTYRTDHYMLSTAQDYRKGVRGSQTHTWQATLDESAIVYTTHPTYQPVEEGDPIPADWNWQRRDEPGPGRWSGEGAQPRATQFENVVVVQYDPQYPTSPLFGFTYLEETHAYFPLAHFDEVVQEGSWTFGRKGDAYVALYSWRPTQWLGGQPEVYENAGLDFDLVAPGGSDNVWISEVGSIDEWPGGFDAFRAAVVAAEVEVTPAAAGFDVRYASPTRGSVEVGWAGPMTVAGETVPVADYPRMSNRYTDVGWGDLQYEISDGSYGLDLDFENWTRSVWATSGNGGAPAK